MNDEERVEQMEKALDLSPEQITFLMGMAYDPEMHEEGSQQQQPEKASRNEHLSARDLTTFNEKEG